MAAVRKSGRIRTRKKSHFPDDEYQYEATGFDLDVSQNISNLLHIHSAESDNDKSEQSSKAFPNITRKLYSIGKVDVENSVTSSGDRNESSISATGAGLCDSNGQISSEHLTLKSHNDADYIGKNKSEKDYVCRQCDKVFSELTVFKRHLKVHTGEKPFKCQQCEKSFSESCSLKRHMKTHEDDRPFTCDVCFKCFRDSTSFNRHQLTHTERPRSFQCSLCEKNFTDKSGLKRHERTHSGQRPYECDVCHKTFSESGSFRRHQKIHVGIRNFHCHRCKRSFMEKQSLIRHQKTVCGFWGEASNDTESAQQSVTSSSRCQDSQDLKASKRRMKASPLVINIESSNSDSRSSKSDSSDVYGSSLSATKIPQKSSNFSALKFKKSSQKGSPSLGSLIKKDPNLYDSISEIVDSIDSYEKMLDLCGDNGQKEIDAALTREPASLPENLMCFECGEQLVDGENFHREGKPFDSNLNNSFRCLNCEDEEETFGDPPVLTAEDNQDEENLSVLDEEESVTMTSDSMDYIDSKAAAVHSIKKPLEHYSAQSELEPLVHFASVNCLDSGGNTILDQQGSLKSDPASTDNELLNLEEKQVVDCQISKNQAMPNLLPIETRQISEVHQNSWDNTKCFDYEVDDPNIPSVFPCHLCTKVFATSSFLEQHLELHRKSPYKCMVCGKMFAGGPALKRHMRVHTGEKPYSCPSCKKKFRDPSNFSKHKRYCSVNGFVPSPVGSTSSVNSGTSVVSAEDTLDNVNKSIDDENQRMSDDEASSHPQDHFDNHVLELRKEETEHEPPQPIMFVSASIDDFDEQSLDSNQNMNEESQVMNYIPCEICQKLCENEQHLEMHMNYHNGNPDVTCIECGKSFADCHGLKRHMRIHAESRPFNCEYCNRGYCDNWSLKKHKSRGCLNAEVTVPVDFLYPCSRCSRVFSDNDLLEEHMKCHKGKVKFECDICLKKFSEAFNLRRHRRLHMTICPGCGSEFKNIEEMTKHQKKCSVATPDKPARDSSNNFPCPDCGRTYSSVAYLERHRKFHSDLKLHVCEICNKKFAEAFKLRRHKRVHSDTKPYICQDCGKGFVDEAFLKRHTLNSSCTLSKTMRGAVNFPCQYCDKIFTKNYMLVRHMNVHSQERPFTCDVCGRAYKDTSSLKRHQLVHQGVKDFICSVCGKAFFYADSLKRHMSGKCGKASKGRRYKSSTGRRPSNIKSVNQDSINNNKSGKTDNNKNMHHTNINSDLRETDHIEGRKLNTSPYKCKILKNNSKMSSIYHQRSKYAKTGPWLCQNKMHCWRCDTKMPSKNYLMFHNRIHHHKKKIVCHRCYARFSRKLYWKAHMSLCPLTLKRSLTKKFTAPHSISDLSETNGQRPRRSIPRARWSWLTQI